MNLRALWSVLDSSDLRASRPSRPAPEERSAPPSFSVSLKAGRNENLLPRRGSCQGTMAASTHVPDPHMHERAFLGYKKGGDSFGLTRGESVPRPPSPPPSPLPLHGAQGAVSRWRNGMAGWGWGWGWGWEEGWVGRIAIQWREARGEVKGSDLTGKLSAFE